MVMGRRQRQQTILSLSLSLSFTDKLVIDPLCHAEKTTTQKADRSGGTNIGEFPWKEREGGGWAWDEGSEPFQQQQQRIIIEFRSVCFKQLKHNLQFLLPLKQSCSKIFDHVVVP